MDYHAQVERERELQKKYAELVSELEQLQSA